MMIREICFRTNSGKKMYTHGGGKQFWPQWGDVGWETRFNGEGWGVAGKQETLEWGWGRGPMPTQLRCIATFLFPDAKYSRAAVISSKSFFSAK